MSDLAIRVAGLSKQYKISVRQTYSRLAEKLIDTVQTGCGLKPRATDPGVLWALKDVSAEIQRGDIVGIIGHNGTGKSTLLKILSRITDPSEGHCEVRGRIGSLLEVGVGFHPDLTGRENVFLSGAILGMKHSEIKRKFDDIVDFAGIERMIDTPVKRYSSGMYVRLAFAVAALLESEILIIDEVLAVGDAAFQQKCIGKVNDVARDGRTVLFVSHNMAAISALSTRVMHLSQGRLKAFGEPSTVISDYMAELFNRGSVDLSSCRGTRIDSGIAFSRIEVEQSDTLKVGEPLILSMELTSTVHASDLDIGGTVYDNTGAIVSTFFTEEKFGIGPGEKLNAKVIIEDLNLFPSRYYMSLFVSKPGHFNRRQDFDVIHGHPVFQVLPILEQGHPMSHWDTRRYGKLLHANASLVASVECLGANHS